MPKPTQITHSPWYVNFDYLSIVNLGFHDSVINLVPTIDRISFRKRVIGNEDCLRLSVYTPDLPVTQNQGKLPVVVWFMGKI